MPEVTSELISMRKLKAKERSKTKKRASSKDCLNCSQRKFYQSKRATCRNTIELAGTKSPGKAG